MTGHVLIVVDTDGTVDYSLHGDVKAVLIDYRVANASSFPDEVDALAKEVKACPAALPWRDDVLMELRRISKVTRSALIDRLPLFLDDADEDPLPDAG